VQGPFSSLLADIRIKVEGFIARNFVNSLTSVTFQFTSLKYFFYIFIQNMFYRAHVKWFHVKRVSLFKR